MTDGDGSVTRTLGAERTGGRRTAERERYRKDRIGLAGLRGDNSGLRGQAVFALFVAGRLLHAPATVEALRVSANPGRVDKTEARYWLDYARRRREAAARRLP